MIECGICKLRMNVIDTRAFTNLEHVVRRRYKCQCGCRVTTLEFKISEQVKPINKRWLRLKKPTTSEVCKVKDILEKVLNDL